MLFFLYSQSVLVLCFDLVLWSYCLLLLTKCDCLVSDLVLRCYILLLLTKCDGLVSDLVFVLLLFVVAQKV